MALRRAQKGKSPVKIYLRANSANVRTFSNFLKAEDDDGDTEKLFGILFLSRWLLFSSGFAARYACLMGNKKF